MNTYTQNYWSFYMNYLKDFESLEYKGYKLSYLIHFPSLVRKHKEFWARLSDPEFSKIVKKQFSAKEVQQDFNRYIRSLKPTRISGSKYGKTVFIADRLLRFPKETFTKYFPRKETMVVITSNKSDKSQLERDNAAYYERMGMPFQYLSKYKRKVHGSRTQIMLQLDRLFKKYKTNFIYRDEMFQNTFRVKIDATIKLLEMAEHLIDAEPIGCFVISSPNHYGRVVAFAAAKKGIPTVCMQHGIIGNELGYIPKVATVDALYGQFDVDWYLQRGAKPGSLAIIGHPRFDQALKKAKYSRSRFAQLLGIDKSKKTLLLIVRESRNLKKWQQLIQQISKQLNVNILLRDFENDKVHPLMKQFPEIRSTKSMQLYDLLPRVDAVVSYTSTVALEAMLVGTPCYIMHSTIPGYSGYYDSLSPFIQKDPVPLSKLIIRFFEDGKQRQYAEAKRKKFLSYAYPQGVPSGKKLKKLIDRLKQQK
ncbi:Lipid-A-disaccharide synthetase [Gracilibacillus ureilyticus]|uniref:Lipid-A-disaccharide synthetase n=1 Tax=Gracilibacillus ureilyticus TaxID=531814 RepID=A0A1H9RU67_9BACI|nr:hypothetical protein [Gracilibacillus ureilyticus]SER76187.1 Lipid-A-disaccharide synthetase [Gracilibacillus ureilyticus]